MLRKKGKNQISKSRLWIYKKARPLLHQPEWFDNGVEAALVALSVVRFQIDVA